MSIWYYSVEEPSRDSDTILGPVAWIYWHACRVACNVGACIVRHTCQTSRIKWWHCYVSRYLGPWLVFGRHVSCTGLVTFLREDWAELECRYLEHLGFESLQADLLSCVNLVFLQSIASEWTMKPLALPVLPSLLVPVPQNEREQGGKTVPHVSARSSNTRHYRAPSHGTGRFRFKHAKKGRPARTASA